MTDPAFRERLWTFMASLDAAVDGASSDDVASAPGVPGRTLLARLCRAEIVLCTGADGLREAVAFAIAAGGALLGTRPLFLRPSSGSGHEAISTLLAWCADVPVQRVRERAVTDAMHARIAAATGLLARADLRWLEGALEDTPEGVKASNRVDPFEPGATSTSMGIANTHASNALFGELAADPRPILFAQELKEEWGPETLSAETLASLADRCQAILSAPGSPGSLYPESPRGSNAVERSRRRAGGCLNIVGRGITAEGYRLVIRLVDDVAGEVLLWRALLSPSGRLVDDV